MIYGLLIILTLIFILPFICKPIEKNLEIFLFLIGIIAALVSKTINIGFIIKVFQNELMYFITLAVFVAALLFKYTRIWLKKVVKKAIKHIPLWLFVFFLVIILGLASSVITAIVSALILVEVANTIPLHRKHKVNIIIISCFSIGLGAVLTPIGEPLSTVIASRLDMGFFYFITEFGALIIPGVIALGIIGALFTLKGSLDEKTTSETYVDQEIEKEESFKDIIFRTIKIFLFIIALELLGESFKPIIDTYIIGLDGKLLYWGNMISSILDNATLAAAEISIKMTDSQIRSILLGLLISGGMLIPGNIPNIISASIFKIESKEWAKLGIPLGLCMMLVYFIILFMI